MLRPIVEAAGYLVIGEQDELSADVTIVSQDREIAPDQAARVLRLATDPDAADGHDSIYRYDRAGLLIALKAAARGGADERAASDRIDRRKPRGAACRGRGKRGRTGHADPGAARARSSRRPVGAAQPRADRHRLPALARAGRDRSQRRPAPRSRRRRARRPSLCADRRCGRGRGRGAVRTGCNPRRDGRRLGARFAGHGRNRRGSAAPGRCRSA